MLIKYTKSNLLGVPYSSGTFYLKPGVNEVDDAVWAEVKKSGILSHQIGGGFIQEVFKAESAASIEKSGESEAIKGLSELNATESMAVIAETYDEDLLKAWAKTETRKTVQKAIAEQLEKVELGEDEADEE